MVCSKWFQTKCKQMWQPSLTLASREEHPRLHTLPQGPVVRCNCSGPNSHGSGRFFRFLRPTIPVWILVNSRSKVKETKGYATKRQTHPLSISAKPSWSKSSEPKKNCPETVFASRFPTSSRLAGKDPQVESLEFFGTKDAWSWFQTCEVSSRTALGCFG